MRRRIELALRLVACGWVLWTLYLVGRFGGAVVMDPSTTSRIMAVRNNQQVHSAIGLTYHGIGGAVLVVAELLLLIAALTLSLSGRTLLRRAGLAVLSCWSLLWLGNALWMEHLAGGDHVTKTTLLAAVTIAMLAWAALRWPAGGRPD